MIGLMLALLLGASDPTARWLSGLGTSAITFNPKQRTVSNWRQEAAWHLAASPGTALAILLGRDPAQVTRCVRLNNYWCIKRAGWAGEIAADREDHVAFASAAEGAAVAALLLRRYYVDYGRHSALSIVSHWAPAACSASPRSVGPAVAAAGRMAAAADHLATHGLGATLRARFLAAHGHRVAGFGKMRMRRSVVPDHLIGAATTMRAPAIAVGLGETPISLGSSLAALSTAAPASGAASVSLGPAAPPAPARLCAADDQRIRAYAAKAAAGIAASPKDDLKLFDAGGQPTVHLGLLMRNMSAVEIGPLAADTALIAGAIDHAKRLAAR